MTELVSVLIPAYNAERWLAATIGSVLAQSWPRIEVIIVDDGSSDGTLALAKASESGSVKVCSQPNMGAAAARNRALDLAQGNYIQWLDADDLLHPEKIAAQMAAAARVSDRRVLLSGSFGSFYYRTARATFVETSLWRDLTPLDYFIARFSENASFQTDVWLVSRELTNAAGPWTDLGSPDDDGEYFCRVVMQSTAVTFVRDARSYYRVGNSSSLANRRSRKATAALFASKEKCIRYLLALEDSPRTRAACIQLLQDWEFHLCEYEDVVAQSQKLAAELGGTLVRRPLKWQYKPIEWLFGYDVSLRARHALRSVKSQIEARIDRLLYNPSASPADESGVTSPHPQKRNSTRFTT